MPQDTVNDQTVEQIVPELVQLIIEALNLELQPQDVDPDGPLYGEGMGLDSIDMLEISLVISKRYGFQMRSDNENNQKIFASPRALAAHIAQHRTQ
jgi:acyl carrier protein